MGKYYERCSECFKECGRKYYPDNHKRQLRLALLRKQRYKEERRKRLSIIKNKEYADCGKIYPPWIMGFDHWDGNPKKSSISWMALRNRSNLEDIKKQIERCDLVCTNCHRQSAQTDKSKPNYKA